LKKPHTKKGLKKEKKGRYRLETSTCPYTPHLGTKDTWLHF
jgi:hypothetical protein